MKLPPGRAVHQFSNIPRSVDVRDRRVVVDFDVSVDDFLVNKNPEVPVHIGKDFLIACEMRPRHAVAFSVFRKDFGSVPVGID
jgi:hypothetical protein